MSRLRFRVDSVLAERGIVFARAMDVGELKVTPRATLGARPVAHVELPRRVREDGTEDLGLVGFFLAYAVDVVHFPIGAVVVFADE